MSLKYAHHPRNPLQSPTTAVQPLRQVTYGATRCKETFTKPSRRTVQAVASKTICSYHNFHVCVCVLTSASVLVLVIHMSCILCITVDKGQTLALKGKGRVHDPVRIHRLDRNGNRKPLIDWLSNTSQKKWLYLSLSTRRQF